jgi:hypothetical protein
MATLTCNESGHWRFRSPCLSFENMPTPRNCSIRMHRTRFALTFLLLAAGSVPLGAQMSKAATRPELEAAARQLELAAASTAYGQRIRGRARSELAAVRRRLADGDFRVGERVAVRITGAQSSLLNDTLTVLDSLILDIPGVRRVRLHGVLHSEVEDRVAVEVGEVVRSAQVSVRPLMRVAVLGAVSTPGFRAVPSEMLVDQLLSTAGSPTAAAQLAKMRFMRADTVLLEGADVISAISQARTLSSLSLRDGDVLLVPAAGAPWDRAAVLQIVGMFMMPLLTIFVLQ